MKKGCEKNALERFEVLNEWRTLNLPIMPPVPGLSYAFFHNQPDLRCPSKHAFVYDY